MISKSTLNRFYWYCAKLSQPSIVLLIFTISCVAFIFSINTSENRYFESTDELSSLVESQKVSFEKVNSPSVVAPIETSKNLKTTSKSASPKPPIPQETKLKSPTNCVCKSEKSGKPHSFCYVDPQNQTSIGKKFDCSHLNILESLAGKYILYSLALYSYQIKRIQSKLKNLEIRTFNTTGYPSYVTHWKEYRFKSLIIAEVMKEYSNIWWLDANIRVEKGNLTELLREEMGDFVEKRGVENTSSVFSFVYTGHSNFPVLFPGTINPKKYKRFNVFSDLLTYFPTNSIPLLKNVKHGSQLGANAVFFAKTKFTMEVLKWWVLCSLDKTCMNPPGAQVSCHFDTDRNNKFAHCFRFDQSVLNLLLLNRFQDNNKYFSKLGYLFSRTS
ncbi:Protein CBG11318 [Caenorhabditis briggsae]|uniref:Protein CBG11318 n=1 Tax=Caenorhabditis briggsae TaxID=6238 RepID=A8XDA8_CAEBR|nr:Protein CBG11318 [Caenorhabditis briggsae]CAP30627.2 Protein CBG11318 [Caenorhabditis briggsae]